MKPKQYLAQIRNKPEIGQSIKKGITTTTIPNIKETNMQQTREHTKKLLSDLVKDPQLLEVLTEEQNIQKLTNRFEYRITFTTENGQYVAKTKAYNKTPQTVLLELRSIPKRLLKKGETPWLDDLITPMGYEKSTFENEGVITKIMVQIIFRKAT